MPESTPILDATAIQRALTRIAHEIAERNEVSSDVALVGIPTGGVPLAQRLGKILAGIWNHAVPVGSLDVSMHRDDLDQRVAPTITALGPAAGNSRSAAAARARRRRRLQSRHARPDDG